MAGEDTSPVGGAVNPYDFLSLIAALSASQTKPTQSGINRLFSPEVGALTGTLYQGDSGGLAQQEEAATMLRLGPDILRASNLPAGDIRAKIANMIYVQKIPVWDVKRRIDQELLQRQQMGEVMDKDATAQEMYAFADKIQSQSDALDANMATAAAKPRTDVFSQGGLPSPEMQFAPEDLAPDYFKKYAEESATRGKRLSAIQAPSAKSRKAALEFLSQQEQEVGKSQKSQKNVRTSPVYESGEGLLASLERNLGNTPMGRGEAGIRGLIPLLKLAEQVPAGAAALYRGVTDPLNEEIANQAKYVAETMFGNEARDVANYLKERDVVGQVLYGRDRERKLGVRSDDKSFQRAEDIRFGRTARDVVKRSEDKGLASERAALTKEQQYADTVRDLVAAGLTKKAQEAGYTPLMVALMKRAQFSGLGGS
jgi:hypothetical protein